MTSADHGGLASVHGEWLWLIIQGGSEMSPHLATLASETSIKRNHGHINVDSLAHRRIALISQDTGNPDDMGMDTFK